MKKILLSLWALLLTLAVNAQMMNPVHFSSQLKTGKGTEAEIIFHATIDKGWHVYSTDIGDNGPIEASFNVVKMEGAELVGKLTPKGKVITQMDKMFNMELKYFENEATFVQKIRFTKPEYDIDCYLEYGTCSDESCLPPSEAAFKQSGKSPIVEKPEKEEVKKEETPSPEAPIINLPLVSRHRRTPSLRYWRGSGSSVLALALAHGLRGGPAGRLHALHLAHHTHDRQLLPETRAER